MDRYQTTKRVGILGISCNLFLLIIKSIVGFLTKSQAMIADSFNSFLDIFSSLMTYIGNRVASKPKDECHNLGHGKAEYIYSLLISIAMMYLSVKLMINVSFKFFDTEKYNFSIWLIIVCIITILVKFSLYLYTNNLYKKHGNLLIKANSLDHRNDCIITTFNLVAAIMTYHKILFVDKIVGIGISLWIFSVAINIFKESYDVLMDKAIDNETKEEVLKLVKKHKEIKKVTHFNSTPVGYKYQVSFTIFVDGNLSTYDSHEIADNLEDEIEEKIDSIYLTVIHVNPIKKNAD